MAAFVKFYQFAEDLGDKVHDLIGVTDTLKVMFTNTAPALTNAVKADITEISAGNGYTAGGFDTQNSGSEASGVLTVTAVDITVTASGGSIGPYRYVVLYNDTPTAPADPLIGYWDKGAAVTLTAGQSDLLDFSAALLTIS